MQEAVLISIHPRFVDAILAGEKLVEFRKVRFSRPVSMLVVYATAPVSAIVAILEVGQVIQDSPSSVWEQYSSVGAVTEQEFWQYYGHRELALAVEIADVHELPTAITLCKILPGGRPPQSFQYVQVSVIADVLDSIGLLDSSMLVARGDKDQDMKTVCEVSGLNT